MNYSRNAIGSASANFDNKIVRRWSKLTKGVNDWDKVVLSKLYENQMRSIGNIGTHLMEASSTAAIPGLVNFTFPLIRDIFPNLISKDLFSFQPTNSPIGGIFFWDYLYGTNKSGVTAGDNVIKQFDYNYSSEYIDNETKTMAAAASVGFNLDFYPVKPAGLGQTAAALEIHDATTDTTIAATDQGDGTVTGVGTTGDIDYATGAVTNLNIGGNDIDSVVCKYFYSMEGAGAMIPEIDVNIQLQAIKVWSRKLKVLWPTELVDDMRAVLDMDIQPELTAGIVSEVSLGIDRELIMAAYGSGNPSVETFDAAVPAGRNQVDHYRNILTPISKQSGGINTDTRRGPGNFIITGPSVQPVLESLHSHGDLRMAIDGGTIPAGNGINTQGPAPLPQIGNGYGIYTMGLLQNRWRVVIDPYFPEGEMLIGRKGQGFADAGVAYAPYVAMEMTDAFVNPTDFSVSKAIRTRYAKMVTNNLFYRRVHVNNLP